MKWSSAAGAMLLVLPLLGLLAFGLTRDARLIPSPLPGQPAPEFALPIVLDGSANLLTGADTIRLSDLQGNVVVLNFWASWCTSCVDEYGPLTRAHRSYRERGVIFLGVLHNDSPANGRRWILRLGQGKGYPTLGDARIRTAIDYGVYGTPETFFIARDGRVAFKQVGPVNQRLLTEQLEALTAEPWPAGETDPDMPKPGSKDKEPVPIPDGNML